MGDFFWSSDCSITWLIGWLFYSMVGWLNGCWLNGWLVKWLLVKWLVG